MEKKIPATHIHYENEEHPEWVPYIRVKGEKIYIDAISHEVKWTIKDPKYDQAFVKDIGKVISLNNLEFLGVQELSYNETRSNEIEKVSWKCFKFEK